jgi:hypothetical protein
LQRADALCAAGAIAALALAFPGPVLKPRMGLAGACLPL